MIAEVHGNEIVVVKVADDGELFGRKTEVGYAGLGLV